MCAPLAGVIAALAMPGPPPPLPPLYRAAGGGRGSEDGCWRSRPAPAHPRRLCPARSPGGGGPFAAAATRCAVALAPPLSRTVPSFFASPLSPCFLLPSLLPLPFRPFPPSRPFAGGFSLGIIGPRHCRQSERAVCPRLPAPPPSGGNGKDTHHAPPKSHPGSTTPGSGESRLPLGTGTGCRHRECEAWVSLRSGTASQGGGTAHPALPDAEPGRLGGAYRHLQAGGGGPGALNPRAALLDSRGRGSTGTF